MSTVRVDDGDSNLFTNGAWVQQQYGPQAYQGTISWAGDAGASKVVRFVGTSISVLGALQPTRGTTSQPLVIQFSIDGGSPETYRPAAPDDFQYVTYYQSPNLPIGEHVLTMLNMAGNDICLLDGFVIQANGGTAQILRSNGSPTPSKGAPPSNPITSAPSGGNPPSNSNPPPSNASPVTVTVQPSSSGSPTNNSPSPSDNTSRPGSSPNSNLPSNSSSNTPSSNPNTTSSTFSASIYNPTTINANDPNGQVSKEISNKTPIIIAAITSVLLVLVLIAIILLFVRRRRRKRRASIDASSNSLLVSPYPPSSPVAVMSQVSSPDKLSAIPAFEPAPYRATSPSGTSGSAAMSTTSSAHISALEPQRVESIGRDEKRRSVTGEGPSQRPMSNLDEAGLPPYVA